MLLVHIQPKAVKTKIVGLYDGCLKIAVKAPPVEGKANSELVRFLADICGVRKNQIEIKTGAQSRRKQIVVATEKVNEVIRILHGFLTDC